MTNPQGSQEPSTPRPLVDALVVTWNSAGVTPDALRHTLDSNRDCEIRLLVRDNASADGTATAIAETLPEAIIEKGEENIGFAAAVNRLIARSSAPWVLLLNPDAWAEPGAIATLVARAVERPRAAAVVPRLENPDGTLQHSTHPFPSVGVAATMLLGRRIPRRRGERMLLEGVWAHDRARPVDWAIGAAMLIRRAALEEIGGLDERFFIYVEDLEWCWRAHEAGWEIFFEPAAVVKHIGNVSGEIAFGDKRTATYMRNTYRFYRREHGAVSTAAYRALNLAGSGVRYAIARAKRDASSAAFWRMQVKANLESSNDARPDR
jgi:N-acetylglucosaminyl-diphospho-decaprenol L-rhamnosyltransferase